MTRDQFDEANKQLAEITNFLSAEGISEEVRQNLERRRAQLAGMVLSNWLPFGWQRLTIMIVLVLVGVYGILDGNSNLLFAWLLLPFFSPRASGELAHAFGRLFGKY